MTTPKKMPGRKSEYTANTWELSPAELLEFAQMVLEMARETQWYRREPLYEGDVVLAEVEHKYESAEEILKELVNGK